MKNKKLSEIHSSINLKLNEFIRIMSISLFLIFAFVSTSQAKEASLQNKTLSMDKTDVQLANIMNEIESQTDYLFVYKKEVDVNMKRTIHAKNESLPSVLNKVFNGTGISYKMAGKHIILSAVASANIDEGQQVYTVKGTVKDKKGETVIGANVVEKGTTNGTITDIDGNFTLEVHKENTILQISYIGYKSVDIEVKRGQVANVVLEDDTEILEEVVVVGYGSQKKVNLTGSVENVTGEKLVDRPIKSVTDALQGAVAGLVVQSASGKPGQFASYKIRGNTSLNSGGALVLIDGIPGDLNTISPNDIENISVLKDAASAAIYGARAAEGVILVTTKTKSDKLKVSYNMNYTYQTPSRIPKSLNSREYAALKNLAYTNAGANPEFGKEALEAINNPNIDAIPSGSQWLYTSDFDWIDCIFDNANQQNHNISISNSSKKIDYVLSANYLKQNGFYAEYGPDGYDRFNVRLNTKVNLIEDMLDVEAKINYLQSNKTYHPGFAGPGGPSSMGVENWSIPYITFIQSGPNMPVKDPNGNWSRYRMQCNPIQALEEGGKAYDKNNITEGNIAVNFMPIKDLNIKGLIGMRKGNYDGMEWRRAYGKYYVDGSSSMFAGQSGPNNLCLANSLTTYTTGQLYANYTVHLGRHYIAAMAGSSFEKQHYDYSFAKRVGITGNELPAFNLGATDGQKTDYDAYEWLLLSGFGRLNYSYADKYLVEFNLRADGSSRFSKSHRWGYFPSVSLGWRLSEENIINKLNVFSNLKLRASYGELGNQQGLGYYDHIIKYDMSNGVYSFLKGDASWVYQASLASESRTWETVRMYNVALDMGFLNNRLTLTGEFFHKVNDDMLVSIEFPAVIGITVPTGNYGKLRTNGWEVSIGWQDQVGDLRYRAGFNLADQKDKLVDYGVEFSGFTPGVNKVTQGYSLGAIFGYKSDGLFQTDEEVKNSAVDPSYKGITAPGDVKYTDLNKDGVINSNDITYLGNTTPRFTFGLNVAAEYKNWDLSAVLQGVGKRSFYLEGQIMNNFRDSWANFGYTLHLDYWTKENRNASMPRPYLASQSNHNTQISSYWVQNASYCRLKNLQIGYTFHNIPLLKNSSIEKVRVYFSGDNLCEYSKLNRSFDPELTTTGGYMYPITRNYALGVNINF